MTDLFEADTATTSTLDMRRLQRNKRRATRRKWTLVVSAVAIVIFAMGASVAWNFTKEFQTETAAIADYPGAGQGQLQIVVNPGDTGSDIATTLLDAGVIASRQAFLTEWNANPEAQGIVPGFYFMHREMKAQYALESLLDPNNRDLRTITVPEGSNLAAFYQRVAAITGTTEAEVANAAKNTEAYGLPKEAKGDPEGWLFPSTYEFNPGVTPTDVLKRMVDTTVGKLEALNVPRKDWLEVLTVASIIEKEVRFDEDRPKVASVIYNRIDQKMPLGMDSTIKFIAPSDGAFTTADDRAIDSPYNTYMHAGLPPGPIASPGEESIVAAVSPADTDYLFFVTVNLDTGETKFTSKYDTHLKYVKELQKWAQADAKKKKS